MRHIFVSLLSSTRFGEWLYGFALEVRQESIQDVFTDVEATSKPD